MRLNQTVLLASIVLCFQNSIAFQTISQVRARPTKVFTKLHEKPTTESAAAAATTTTTSSASSASSATLNRRQFAFSIPVTAVATFISSPVPSCFALDETAAIDPVQVVATGDIKKLFNEGRAMESQGNILAAQRLFAKVTKVAPRVSEVKMFK